MLRRFVYLNEKVLDGYLSALEGGLVGGSVRHERTTGALGGGVSVAAGPVELGAKKDRENFAETTRNIQETPEQRFDRLMRLLEDDPDAYLYEAILDMSDAFPRLTVGSFVTVDCELEIPPGVRLFCQPEEMDKLLNLADTMRSIAPVLGEDIDGLPSAETAASFRGLLRAMESKIVVVGDQYEGAPRIVAKLDNEHLRDSPEGAAYIVGKVVRRLEEGDTYPLLAIPGASLMNREQRRKAKPDVDSDSLEGPAVVLDALAIYL